MASGQWGILSVAIEAAVTGSAVARPAALEIVVPARNEARRLPEGLAALCHKAATLPLPTAIIVVDSASTDGRTT